MVRVTGDINPHRSDLKNIKMTIACNSAYIQTETVNFTFTQQYVIVHFDAKRRILMYKPIIFASHVAVYINSQHRPTLNFYLPCRHVNMDEHPKRNPHYARFASKLAQNSPKHTK